MEDWRGALASTARACVDEEDEVRDDTADAIFPPHTHSLLAETEKGWEGRKGNTVQMVMYWEDEMHVDT